MLFSGSRRKPFASMANLIQRAVNWGSEMLMDIFHDHSPEDSSIKGPKSIMKVLDPQGPFLQKWNKIFVLSCVMAVSVDPLSLYTPVVNRHNQCVDLDSKLEITASVLRSFTDFSYILHIIFQFRTGFIAPPSRVFGRGDLVEDLSAIARRYLSSYFFIDILAVLPLPQFVVLIIIPRLKGSTHPDAKNLLMLIVVLQYVPRLVRIIPLYLEITKSSGIITETVWAGSALNLLLYMLASHVLGAFWYFLSIEREYSCWTQVCADNKCSITSWYCRKDVVQVSKIVSTRCKIDKKNKNFNFGMYLLALEDVVQSWNFWPKLFYCLWWGLQNLSSLGQNLETSTYVWETLFAVFISISGLVLFALLIGNMQESVN